MNQLSSAKRAQVIRCLVEGMSIRATVRMTGAAKNTVVKLLRDLGDACTAYCDAYLRELVCLKVQCDEIWAFCYAKEKNVPDDKRGEFGYGDVWTFTALDAETKLIPSWFIGRRDTECATAFLMDLRERLINRPQIITDGLTVYGEATWRAFGNGADVAELCKSYAVDAMGERRYSPPVCVGAKKRVVRGWVHRDDISTSYVERQNLTMRMSMRRLTRLTNGFSKKVENLEKALAVHFFVYNFCRVHQSLPHITPAMAAKKTDHVWTVEEMAWLLDWGAKKSN
jgi:IS1 family transposase